MSGYVWYIGFAASLVFSIFVSLTIGRRVFKTGVEHFSGRILILGAITDVVLCSVFFLFQGANELYRIASSTPQSLSRSLVPIILLAVPCRIVWNYFAIQKRLITQHGLRPSDRDVFTATVSSLSKAMNIPAPTVLSSDKVSTPFVFGFRSSKAILAIPRGWQKADSDQHHILLLHELGHIRNHDVGFLAWSTACIQDLRLLLVIFPVLIVCCYFFGLESLAPTILAYLMCLFILHVLLRYVVRKRELLADLTAAMLVESGQVCEVIFNPSSLAVDPCVNSGQQVNPRLADRIQRWLTDKALFSKRQRVWRLLLGVFNFVHLLHPTRPERVEAVGSQSDFSRLSDSSLGESFWAGVALGLLGVIIALGGYWLGATIATPQEGIDTVRLPFQIYGMMSPIPLAFLSMFLALPAWSSLKQPILNGQFLLSLVTRYGVAFAGACLVSPLILIARTSILGSWMLLALCIVWFVFVVAFGFAFNIVFAFLWITIRYFPSSRAAELKQAVGKFGLFIMAVFGLIIIGGALLRKGTVFYAVNTICSTVIGVALVSATTYGRFSEAEQYYIVMMPFVTRRVEGERFRLWALALHSFFLPALLLLYTLLSFIGIHLILGRVLGDLDVTAGIFLTGAVCCVVLVLLEWGGSRRIKEAKRLKIYSFCHSLKLLSQPLDSQVWEKIKGVIRSYDLPTKRTKKRFLNLTVNDISEVVVFISDDPTQDERRLQVVKWILDCQRDGGFGVWPGSTARLQATYQALLVLQDLDALDQCRHDSHVQWIRERQQPKGSFDGPWSRLPTWENTFYAARSLDILGASMSLVDAQTCQDWCKHNLINAGVGKDRADVIYYCLGTLNCLGEIDARTLELVSDWLFSKTDELLLTNVSLDYENVHCAAMIYQLLTARTAAIPDESQMKLLAQRIHTALDAELHDIPA